MDVELTRATPEQLPIVRNLVAYYVYDMAKVIGWDCSDEGIFGGSDDIAEYWQQGHPETSDGSRWPADVHGSMHFVTVDGSSLTTRNSRSLCSRMASRKPFTQTRCPTLRDSSAMVLRSIVCVLSVKGLAVWHDDESLERIRKDPPSVFRRRAVLKTIS